jgi:dihydroorotate dehydrogenase (fumarate)
MDLSTNYLGLRLAHPLMAGASPLVDDMDTVRRLEDAGASAIVMHSLFEEQIEGDAFERAVGVEVHDFAHPEAQSYFPRSSEYALGPDEYLEQLTRIHNAVDVPVIGSLNGTTLGMWLEYAQLMEVAGADALELNLYGLSVDPAQTAVDVELRAASTVAAVRRSVDIPIAVKLSPQYTALPAFARALSKAGADGLVLFNRFYQADIDPEALEAVRVLRLSDPSELLLRLRWTAILSPWFDGSLAISGGVHRPIDAVKAIMSGAHGVQLVSALLLHGPGHLTTVLDGLRAWMVEHEYESLEQMRGSMNHARCPDPRAFERANYVRLLQSWQSNNR